MSVVFVPERLRGKAEVNQETLQRLLEENDQLIRCIVEYQSKGRATDCVQSFKIQNVQFQFRSISYSQKHCNKAATRSGPENMENKLSPLAEEVSSLELAESP
uniref:SS18 like 2 n=1 Tax=Gallus gallus TaxID=9031 RepID=A0A8V0Y9Y7_CHICK